MAAADVLSEALFNISLKARSLEAISVSIDRRSFDARNRTFELDADEWQELFDDLSELTKEVHRAQSALAVIPKRKPFVDDEDLPPVTRKPLLPTS